MSGDRGFTYVFVLMLLFLIGLSMATAGKVWSKFSMIDKEEEMLFRGDQIRRGLESYQKSGHGGMNFLPLKLEDLLKDARSLAPKRHLRKLYKDPMTVEGEWDLIRNEQGRIKGVRSFSTKEPLKKKNFPSGYTHFEGKGSYKDWEFMYTQIQTSIQRTRTP